MDASGSTVDMYATLELDRGTLPTNLKFYTTSDHKSELHKYYSFLEKSGTTSETLKIYWYWNPYLDDEEDNKFINVSNLEAKIRVSAVQISEYAMMKNGHNAKSEFWSDTYRKYIRTITFENNLSNLPSNCTEENLCWDVSYSSSQNKKVYGYLVDSGLVIEETDTSTSTTTTKPLYNLYIVSEAPIFASKYCNNMFEEFKNLGYINFNNNFNTSKVTDMESMFYNCSSLTTLDLSNFNTLSVTDMKKMFWYCSSLTSLDLSTFNTSNVTMMGAGNQHGMFRGCSSLKELDLSNFNTTNVIDMGIMFGGCKSLISLDLSSFNTANVTNMSAMFSSCSSLTSLDLSSFNTANVTNMDSMFSSCSSLTSLDLNNFNTSQVINMDSMFSSCSSLTSVDLSNFNTTKVTNMSSMFSGCNSLTVLDLSGFNTSNVIDFNRFSTTDGGMFYGCSKLQTQINITNANTATYAKMFESAASDPSAHIIIGYIADTETIANAMRDTCTDATAKARIELKKID